MDENSLAGVQGGGSVRKKQRMIRTWLAWEREGVWALTARLVWK